MDDATLGELAGRLDYVAGDYRDPQLYQRLAASLDRYRAPVFYLAIPPDLFENVVTGLRAAGLHRGGRAVVEKPFGRDVPLGVGSRDGQPPGFGAGGQQEFVVGQAVAAGEHHLVPVAIEGPGGAAPAQIDVVAGVSVGVVDENAVPFGFALQVLLGQRRPFVGTLRLVPDENDPAVETLLAQGFRGFGAGQAGTDDHESGLTGHC